MPVIEQGGERLYVEVAGEPHTGTPLVLLHAFPYTSRMWAAQIAALSDIAFVLAPDLRGFGRSARNDLFDARLLDTDRDFAAELEAESMAAPHSDPPHPLDGYVDDVLAVLDHFSIEKPVICGLSLGGYVALALHRRAHRRIAGLILADTRATPDTAQSRRGRIAQMEGVRQNGVQAVLDVTFANMFTPAGLDMPAAADARDIALSNQSEGVLFALRELAARPDSTPYLKNISVSTLIIVGADDKVTPLAESETLRDGINGGRDYATLHVIPNAAHLSNMEAPAEFNRLVRDFLQRF